MEETRYWPLISASRKVTRRVEIINLDSICKIFLLFFLWYLRIFRLFRDTEPRWLIHWWGWSWRTSFRTENRTERPRERTQTEMKTSALFQPNRDPIQRVPPPPHPVHLYTLCSSSNTLTDMNYYQFNTQTHSLKLGLRWYLGVNPKTDWSDVVVDQDKKYLFYIRTYTWYEHQLPALLLTYHPPLSQMTSIHVHCSVRLPTRIY